jgi:hypothetical protein
MRHRSHFILLIDSISWTELSLEHAKYRHILARSCVGRPVDSLLQVMSFEVKRYHPHTLPGVRDRVYLIMWSIDSNAHEPQRGWCFTTLETNCHFPTINTLQMFQSLQQSQKDCMRQKIPFVGIACCAT